MLIKELNEVIEALYVEIPVVVSKDKTIQLTNRQFVYILDDSVNLIYSLQSLIPLLPANERELEENDWMLRCRHVHCPDPEGGVIWRIDRIESP